MLRQRIITALILVALLLGTLALPGPWPFALATLLLMVAGAWEWARLVGLGAAAALGSGGVMAALGLLALGLWRTAPQATPALLWWAVCGVWAVLLIGTLSKGASAWMAWPKGLRLALGVGLLLAAWWALLALRESGTNVLLSALCVVWVADIAAYFGGRAFGRRKLAPTISPGKSWEGVWSGVAGVLALGAAWLWLDHHQGQAWGLDSASLNTQLVRGVGWGWAALALLVLCALSVAGDLFESLIKRAAGAKDSSALLPGHGGVLDRVDALLPVLPAAMALLSAFGQKGAM